MADNHAQASSRRPKDAPVAVEALAYSVATASKVSSLSKSTLAELIAEGDLPAVKIRRRTLILARDLRDFLERGRKIRAPKGAAAP